MGLNKNMPSELWCVANFVKMEMLLVATVEKSKKISE